MKNSNNFNKYIKYIKYLKYIKFTYVLFVLFFTYLISGIVVKRYYNNYPTLRLYPDNLREIEKVKKYINERNSEMYDFIKLTDRSCSYAFIEYVDEDIAELDNISQFIVPYIIFFKNIFNRARPCQIDTTINKYPSVSAFSPSFPSGHSAQAQYLAKILSKKYPEKREMLYKIAEKCGKARIYAGLHYPSDHEFSKFLISILP